MQFRHLIITRFNIRIDRDAESTLSDEWMQNRLVLFERYCLPSVQAQTCKDFTWLVLMDKNTPQPFRIQMVRYAELCPMMQVEYVQPTADITAFYRDLVQPYLTEEYLLTTRLDNDDVIAPTFVENLQGWIGRTATTTTTTMAISFRKGAQLYIQDKVALWLSWKENHFSSLLEATSQTVHTILDYDHTTVQAQQIETSSPMWGEIVHGENVTNDYTPHICSYVRCHAELPFPNIGQEYNRYWHNVWYKMLYHLRYRWRGVSKRVVALFR